MTILEHIGFLVICFISFFFANFIVTKVFKNEDYGFGGYILITVIMCITVGVLTTLSKCTI